MGSDATWRSSVQTFVTLGTTVPKITFRPHGVSATRPARIRIAARIGASAVRSGRSKSTSSACPAHSATTASTTTCMTPPAAEVMPTLAAATGRSEPLASRYLARRAMPPALAGVNRFRKDCAYMTSTVCTNGRRWGTAPHNEIAPLTLLITLRRRRGTKYSQSASTKDSLTSSKFDANPSST